MKPLLAVCLWSSLAFADLNWVMSEPNLEKRSDRALENADEAVGEARKSYRAQDMKAFATALKEVRDSVELSYKSLQESGKAARRSPKYFKRADARLRELAKKLDNLEKDVMMDERTEVTALKKRVDELDEQVVLDIMTKK